MRLYDQPRGTHCHCFSVGFLEGYQSMASLGSLLPTLNGVPRSGGPAINGVRPTT